MNYQQQSEFLPCKLQKTCLLSPPPWDEFFIFQQQRASNFNVNTNYLESLLQNSNSAGLARALIFCLSNKLLGVADAAGPGTIL